MKQVSRTVTMLMFCYAAYRACCDHAIKLVSPPSTTSGNILFLTTTPRRVNVVCRKSAAHALLDFLVLHSTDTSAHSVLNKLLSERKSDTCPCCLWHHKVGLLCTRFKHFYFHRRGSDIFWLNIRQVLQLPPAPRSWCDAKHVSSTFHRQGVHTKQTSSPFIQLIWRYII